MAEWVPQKKKTQNQTFIHRVNKCTEKNTKIKFFWTLEINQNFGTMQKKCLFEKQFYLRKWLKLLKISKLSGIIICHFLLLCSLVALKTNSLANTVAVKWVNKQTTVEQNRFGALQMFHLQMVTWKLPEKPHSQELSFFE